MWVKFNKMEIKVEKTKGISGWGIAVERSQAVKSLQLLQELKLPHGLWREKEQDTSSIMPSKEERQLNRERQLGRSIEGSLLSLPNIVDAHVHLVIPFGDLLGKSTASVLVVSNNAGTIQPQQLREIVAGATSIQKEFVAVTIVSDQEYSSNTSPKKQQVGK